MVAVIILALGGVAFVPLIIVLDGWVLSTVWGWIIVPVFGLPALGIAGAIGVSAVASLLRGSKSSTSNKDDGWKWLAMKIAQVCIVLVVAWTAKQFI